MTKRLILASKSASRRAILDGAGIPFEAVASEVDEAVIKRGKLAAGASPADIALALAEAKALAVTAPDDALVLGGDQVLDFEGQLFDKPETLAAAAERLQMMSGKTHYLRGALALALGGETIWRHQSTAALTQRELSAEEARAYVDACGEGILRTVGGYELEGLGARLFDKIDGDYFCILGLDLLAVLTVLRKYQVVPW